MKLCFWIATERNEKFMRELINVSSTLVLPKQRDKSTKSTLPFYHWNIGKSCYLPHPRIKAWNTDFPENLKTLACYILFWSRYIDWKPTSNILYFNSSIILKEMCKRNHSFLFFKIYEIRYQNISNTILCIPVTDLSWIEFLYFKIAQICIKT